MSVPIPELDFKGGDSNTGDDAPVTQIVTFGNFPSSLGSSGVGGLSPELLLGAAAFLLLLLVVVPGAKK